MFGFAEIKGEIIENDRTFSITTVLSNLCISFEVYNFFHVILHLMPVILFVEVTEGYLLFICNSDGRKYILDVLPL
jgi:hypothetical protein